MQCFPLLLQIDALLNSVGTMAFVTTTFVLWPGATKVVNCVPWNDLAWTPQNALHYMLSSQGEEHTTKSDM